MDRPLVSIERQDGQVRVVGSARALGGEGLIRVASTWYPNLREAVAAFQSVVDRALAQPLRGRVLQRLAEELAKKA